MDTLDNYLQRYLSFNIRKTLLEHFRERASSLGDVYSFAIDQANLNGHFELYKSLFEEAEKENIKIDRSFNKTWYDDKKSQFLSELSKKEAQLNSDLRTNIKPSIQASYLAIAKLHINSGSHKDFEIAVIKAQEVQPNNPEALLYVKIAALLNGRFDDVKTIISKYEDNSSFANLATENKSLYVYGRAIQGLIALKFRDFHTALNAFLEVNPEVVSQIGLFSSLADLAKYIVILAIITLRRDDIKSKVFESLKNDYKLFSGYAKQIINQSQIASKFLDNFLNANYEDMMAQFHPLLFEWENDRYVSGTKDIIVEQVLERAVKQYLVPLKKVQIETISTVFNITNLQVEEILKNLILSKQLKFKIDKVNKVFFKVDLILKLVVSNEKDELSREHLVKKASNIVANYCFEKQYAVLKVGFNVLNNTRHKGKSVFESND